MSAGAIRIVNASCLKEPANAGKIGRPVTITFKDRWCCWLTVDFLALILVIVGVVVVVVRGELDKDGDDDVSLVCSSS